MDTAAFEQSAQRTTPEELERAAALYTGDFLDGFRLKEAAFDERVEIERERFRRRAIEVLERLIALSIHAGATERAVAVARRLLAIDPAREPVHRSRKTCSCSGSSGR